IMQLKNGYQICADTIIIDGECQVNESLLTGEADPVHKKVGDEILSGSFLVSGGVRAKVIHVGKDNYVNKIIGQAKYIKKPNSEILKSVKWIIKMVTIILVPVAALLFMNQIRTGQAFPEAIVAMVAAVIGMIPSGLVLLTSMVLAVSVVRMATQKTLVQELYCIETLARVDVLCLDKTGTITEGTMIVEDVVSLDDAFTKESIGELLSAYTSVLDDNNPTFDAVREYASSYSSGAGRYEVVSKEDFSSAKKRSSVTFKDEGVFYLGALEFIAPDCDEHIKKQVAGYAALGLRVLTLARETGHIVGLVVISDKIRAEAKDALMYFRSQGVGLKVISGDNPVTVANIAKKAGLYDADNCIDASTLKTDEQVRAAALKYSVFGRVTPNQKLIIVKALQEAGHTVAMTGDGVNDVMALKEADCSIAMESGSDAARTVSQLVLLDSNFAHMPDIVAEGRKTINNIQRSAALYINKTIYSTILAILFVFLPFSYPFEPIQLTLIGSLSIGLPSIVLALEPNLNRIKGSFLQNVLRMAIPAGFLIITNIMITQIFALLSGATVDERCTMAVFGLAIASAVQLYKVCMPFNKIRTVMYTLLMCVFCLAVILFGGFFSLHTLTIWQWIVLAVIAVCSPVVYAIYKLAVETIMGTEPNKYTVIRATSDDKNVLMVLDDVERKDYYDITVLMKGLKVLRADSVIFMKTIEDCSITIESGDVIGESDIDVAAAYMAKRLEKSKSNAEHISVIVSNDGVLTDEATDERAVVHKVAVDNIKSGKTRKLKLLF
ncbi:MAG: HAD-IC family P-type ATPase, partial [Lachnospiraceae bacterium]|nr:HAD-IC family P-type ATPase [Lachnospiraceae bacterium]